MRNIIAAVVIGLGFSAGAADASWLSQSLRNTHVNVNVGPGYGYGGYGQGYYQQSYAPPCAPVYVAPPCHQPIYPSYGQYNQHNHHDRYEFRGRGEFRGRNGHGHGHNHRH